MAVEKGKVRVREGLMTMINHLQVTTKTHFHYIFNYYNLILSN